MRAALAALRPSASRHPLPAQEGRPKALNALGTLAYHPALAEAFNTFNGHILFASTLSARERELLVLRVAAVRGSDYEWAQHTVLAGDAGLSVGGDQAGGGRAGRRRLVRCSTGPSSGPPTSWWKRPRCPMRRWAVLTETFDEQQMLDLVFTVGAYDALAMVFRSFGVEIDDDLAGHELRRIEGLS